jgi:hypothetical protein
MRTGRTKSTVWLTATALLLVLGWYLWGSRGTPPGQPALTSLTEGNFEKFRSDFNSGSGEARLVLLLSPT